LLINNLGLRRKKIFTILFLFLFCFSFSFASLIDIYKKGKIKLAPDLNFGKGTEWDMYFPQGIKDIAFTKDGNFFATGLGNKAHHCVYKFDNNGKFIKKFGRKGRGPGDLYAPGDLPILDNKYLLISEYATNRRISVFDLNGNFVKIIKTKDSVFGVKALKNDKIAILSEKFFGETVQYIVYLKNIKTGKEKIIKKVKKKEEIKGPFSISRFHDRIYLFSTNLNEIIVGPSFDSTIGVYDFTGKELKKIDTGYERKICDNETKKVFYKYLLNWVKEKIKKNQMQPVALGLLKKQYKNGNLIPEHTQCYSKLIIDSEGNILVFKNNKYSYDEKKKELIIKDKIGFKVFTENGKFIKEILMNPNNKVAKILSNERIWFYKDYIYYFDDEDDECILKRAIMK